MFYMYLNYHLKGKFYNRDEIAFSQFYNHFSPFESKDSLHLPLLGYVYKEATLYDLPIIVVDLDDSPLSHKIIDALDDNQYIRVGEVRHNAGLLRNEIIIKNILLLL